LSVLVVQKHLSRCVLAAVRESRWQSNVLPN
jgi:hypothetical protein